MSQFRLFHENIVLAVQSQELIQHVIKLCSLKTRVFILGKTNKIEIKKPFSKKI